MVKNTRKDELDRFFTTPEAVTVCLENVNLDGMFVVEPSAGSGAFSSRMPGCVALDLEPAGPEIAQADFLTWSPPVTDRPVAVVGNPPYGVGGALIVRFIKKACSFADIVAFILPLSYAKESMHARWPRNFHLVKEVVLPTPNATLHGEPTNTRNVWQVWERRVELRPPNPAPLPIGWMKVAPYHGPHFAIRTVGGPSSVGRLADARTANWSSHVFFKVDHPVNVTTLAEHLDAHVWPDLNMAQTSIGSRDYVPVLNEAVELART